MTDVFSKAERSELMARVRGRGNKATELAMVGLLRSCRIVGWRRHVPLFGNPDFVFRKYRLAVFVDGCFWHGCPKHASQPATNAAFWRKKLHRNKERDHLVGRTLKKRGWRVLRVWQHKFVRANQMRLVLRLRKSLKSAP